MNRRVDYSNKASASKPANKRRGVNKRTANKSSNHKASNNKKTASVNKGAALSEGGSQGGAVLPMGMLQAWLSHHLSSCVDSFQRLLRTPWQSMMTWMVVAIALIFPAALYLGLHNVQSLGGDWQSHSRLSVYAKYEAKPLAIDRLQQELEANVHIASVERITPEAGKQDFQQQSGLGEILASLEVNPLPTVFMVTPVSSHQSPESLAQLQQQLQAKPLIDLVQLDVEWLRRLQAMMGLIESIVIALASLLAIGVLLIIGNTIRLAIDSRRSEIVVVKMVGGTDGFVRRPFLYTGLWYGIGGGVCAALLLLVLGWWLQAPLDMLVALYDSNHSLSWLSFSQAFFLVGGAGVLGWLGAWVAVARHLQQIEPE